LSQQTEIVQDFLLHTSILNRFCAPLCDALLGIWVDIDGSEGKASPQEFFSSSADLLSYLEQQNLFVEPLDHDRTWFRYHHLFREILYHRFKLSSSAEEIVRCHKSASEWLSLHNHDDEAFSHLFASNDQVGAARFIEEKRITYFNRQDRHNLRRWITMMPEEFVDRHPVLLLTQAWILQFQSNLFAMKHVLNRVNELLESGENIRSAEQRRSLQGEANALWGSYWLIEMDDVERGIECAQNALKDLPHNFVEARGFSLAWLGLSYLLQGEKAKAERLLRKATDGKGHGLPSRFQAYIALCFIHLLSGELDELGHKAGRFIELGIQSHQNQSIAWGHYFYGCAFFEWDDLETAKTHFSNVVALPYNVAVLTYQNSMIALAMIHLAQKNYKEARNVLETLQEQFYKKGASTITPEIFALQARIALEEGDLTAALKWVKSNEATQLCESFSMHTSPNLLRARILCWQGSAVNLNEAEVILHELRTHADARHNTHKLIKILCQLALVYEAQDRAGETLDTITQAVDLAQPGGYLRPFLDMGPIMEQLLRRSLVDGVTPEKLERILSAYRLEAPSEVDRSVNPVHQIRQSSKTMLIEPLTRRESEVLMHLAADRTNREISEIIVVSPDTVKKHTIAIYQKLGVHSRGEAVATARKLRILSP
jgi:LuxR family maltose regulon positive regulatory protein